MCLEVCVLPTCHCLGVGEVERGFNECSDLWTRTFVPESLQLPKASFLYAPFVCESVFILAEQTEITDAQTEQCCGAVMVVVLK